MDYTRNACFPSDVAHEYWHDRVHQRQQWGRLGQAWRCDVFLRVNGDVYRRGFLSDFSDFSDQSIFLEQAETWFWRR